MLRVYLLINYCENQENITTCLRKNSKYHTNIGNQKCFNKFTNSCNFWLCDCFCKWVGEGSSVPLLKEFICISMNKNYFHFNHLTTIYSCKKLSQ